ncbi:helix-turn-helix domain-containing protein [Macrococcoides caseolyticum]|nr:helix-turn-helix transcriptional regulator [Macrococcus caseolyticus]
MSETRYVKLRMLLEERGIKHKEMAELLGINVGTFSQKINRRKSNFTMDEAITIAKYLNVKMEDIFFD